MVEENLYILVFMFSRTLSLKASFLEIFSLILACSKMKSLKDGCLGLEELLPRYLPW
jgi:hypothetical protein